MIKAEWCSIQETKNQQGKNLTKYAGSISAYLKREKIGRVMTRKVATSRKSRNHKLTMKNKAQCSLSVFDCPLYLYLL